MKAAFSRGKLKTSSKTFALSVSVRNSTSLDEQERERKRQQEVVECLLKLMSGTRLRREIIKERATNKKEMISIMLMIFEVVCLIFSFIYAPLRLLLRRPHESDILS